MYKESAFPAVCVHCEKAAASCTHFAPVSCRVRQGELPEGQEKVLWGTTSYPSGYLHKIGKEWKALHSPLFLMFNSALQWTPPALQVLAQLVSLFALGC